MNVLVCGQRKYINFKKIYEVLNEIESHCRQSGEDLFIIEGEASGADNIAKEWTKKNLGEDYLLKFPANWKKYGRAAGAIRNKQMLNEGKPDLVLAFYNDKKESKGTVNMVHIANLNDVKVLEFKGNQKWICKKCYNETDRLQIAWGESGGEKVDILDYMCPHCLHTELIFQGNKKELQEYWDMEWST